ncbi:MAG: DNA-directed RNA polymerase [Candidatus Micrarchaeia archaeon]
MYYKYTIKDTISIPPTYFGEDINKVTTTLLRNKYERILDKDMGLILVVYNVRDISDGYLLPGDPSTHHDLTFDALAFKLEVEEVVVGEVSELVEFGCFVEIGPLEGLVHLSQITSDFISFDRKSGVLSSRNTGKVLKKGDVVYTKVSTISWKSNIKDSKIALTMRPEGLGKEEWLLEANKPQKEKKKQQKKGK